MKGYNSEEFIIECLKYKFPLFEFVGCESYVKIVQTQVKYYMMLFDMLQDNIPSYYFKQNTYSTFVDTVTSKNNVLVLL